MQSEKRPTRLDKCPPQLRELIDLTNRLVRDSSNIPVNLTVKYSKAAHYEPRIVSRFKNFRAFIRRQRRVIQKAYNCHYRAAGFDAEVDLDLIVEFLGNDLFTKGHERLGLTEPEWAEFILDRGQSLIAAKGREILDDESEFNRFSLYDEREAILAVIREVKTDAEQVTDGVSSEPQSGMTQARIRVRNGILEVELPTVLEVAKNFDLKQLRQCSICDRIFWAKRTKSKTCSERCGLTERQRTYRQANLEAINTRRRENYEYKNPDKKKTKRKVKGR